MFPFENGIKSSAGARKTYSRIAQPVHRSERFFIRNVCFTPSPSKGEGDGEGDDLK